MSELEDYLRHLSEHARFDSNGQFTLDPERLREAQARWTVAEPVEVLLHLVQAGYASSCSAIEVKDGDGTLELALSYASHTHPFPLEAVQAAIQGEPAFM